jgi:hypothetical protein
MQPEGDGYMPLFCAAQWIATEGAVLDFDPAEEGVSRRAYKLLLAAIASDKVHVIGTNGGRREPVPGFNFADCEVSYPFSESSFNLLLSRDLYLLLPIH